MKKYCHLFQNAMIHFLMRRKLAEMSATCSTFLRLPEPDRRAHMEATQLFHQRYPPPCNFIPVNFPNWHKIGAKNQARFPEKEMFPDRKMLCVKKWKSTNMSPLGKCYEMSLFAPHQSLQKKKQVSSISSWLLWVISYRNVCDAGKREDGNNTGKCCVLYGGPKRVIKLEIKSLLDITFYGRGGHGLTWNCEGCCCSLFLSLLKSTSKNKRLYSYCFFCNKKYFATTFFFSFVSLLWRKSNNFWV